MLLYPSGKMMMANTGDLQLCELQIIKQACHFPHFKTITSLTSGKSWTWDIRTAALLYYKCYDNEIATYA
jgi:hypothetical protein